MPNEYGASAIEALEMMNAWRDSAIRWKLSWRERDALLPSGGVNEPSPPERIETPMRVLIETGHGVCFEDDVAPCGWPRNPKAMWNWHSPPEVMSASPPHLRRFRAFVEQGCRS